MKWKNLYNDCRPLFKCGDAVAGALVSAVVGGATAAVSDSMQQSNQSRQRGWQSAENQVNRAWQSAEAQKVRDFASQQQLQQNQFQSDLQSQQQQYNLQSMHVQNQLNSPLHQRQQLEAAGINPQVYFGSQSSFGGTSAQSGGSPQAGAPVTSPLVGGVQGINPLPYQPIGTSLGSIIGSLGSSLRDVAQAKKLGIESDWLPNMLREQVRNLKADTDLKTLLKVGQDIHNQLDNARLPFAVKQAEADLYRTLSETNLNEARQLTEGEQARLNQALTKLQDSLKNLNDKETEKLGLEMPYYVSLIRAKINELGASASKQKEEAGLAHQQTVSQTLINNIKEATNLSDIENAIAEAAKVAKQQGLDNLLIFAETVKAAKTAKLYQDSNAARTIDAAIEKLRKSLGIGVNVSAGPR